MWFFNDILGCEMIKCPFCEPEFEPKNRYRMLDITSDDAWVMVPREPATFGHVLVVSKKRKPQHIDDITCLDKEQDIEQFKNIMEQIVKISKILKKLNYQGRNVKKVYVLSLCETPHLHFHLIPRYERENTWILIFI